MAFNLPPFIKEHPYAVGGVVIVGGIIVFYLLSGSQSSGAASSGSSLQAQELQAAEAEAQINAGTQVQNAMTSAQLQAAQDQLTATNNQTQASVDINNTNTAAQLAAAIYGTQAGVATTQSNNNAAITEEANQELSQQNIYSLQEAELEDQINSGVVENANNNATAVAGAQIMAGLDTTALGDSLTLAQQQESDAYNLTSQNNAAFDSEIPYIVQNAGDQKNSALDANDQTALFQTILSKGNPSVATSGNATTASAVASGNSTSVGTILAGQSSSLLSGAGGILNGLFG